MRSRLVPFLTLLLGVVGCEATAPTGATTAAAPTAATLTAQPAAEPGADDAMTWVERTPEGVPADAKLPLVVAIHGLGDAPERFCQLFEGFRAPARIACPRAFARHGRNGWSWFPVRTEGDTQARDIGAAADRLADAIEALRVRRGAPPGVIVTGFSQGGALSFALAVRHADRVIHSVPIGGWLPPGLHPAGPARVASIEALHGEADDRVPPGPTRELAEALAAGGSRASFRGFPGVGHTLPPPIRSALFEGIERGLDAGRETRERGAP